MKESFSLPDDQCRRLVRNEMTAVRMLLAGLSTVGYAKDDLQAVLALIPNGKRRLMLLMGQYTSLTNDIIGVISKAQCRQIYGTMKDYEMRLLPKATPSSRSVIMTKEEGMELIDCARWKCHSCVEDGTSCRKCKLYSLLEATSPPDDYGDGLLCPYALAEWE